MVRQFINQIGNATTPSRCRHDCRAGVTIVELLVAISVLLTAMTLLTSLCFHVQQVWKDVRHQQVAVGELSNQLERLTRLTRAQAEVELVSLQASSSCTRTLRQPELSGELIDDQLGVRVTLTINWKRRHPGKPIQLAGWLNPPKPTSNSEPKP